MRPGCIAEASLEFSHAFSAQWSLRSRGPGPDSR